ncbi:DUF4338 domain-containing protein [Paenibacillus sp. CC-CFT747]|nr:DUF4338 domain-containing protein [Paenibacillus sp. CC-CFT747]
MLQQEWDVKYSEGTLYAIPPEASTKDNQEIKSRIKKDLVKARNEQFQEPSIKRFILDIESPKWYKGRYVSVLNHFLKPDELYRDLERRLNAPIEIREQLLLDSIKPYVQMVGDERDAFSNIRLSDIWRYARYSWSLPQSSQPGRQINYLIRDAARDFHPIIGIGALGSSIVQITSRDNYIGWTLESAENDYNPEKRDKNSSPPKVDINDFIPALLDGLEEALKEVYHQDFNDFITEETLRHPTDETFERLQEKIEVSAVSRSRDKATGDFQEDANLPMFVSKRATELQQLLSARLVFEKILSKTTTNLETYLELSRSEGGRKALGVALRSIKRSTSAPRLWT